MSKVLSLAWSKVELSVDTFEFKHPHKHKTSFGCQEIERFMLVGLASFFFFINPFHWNIVSVPHNNTWHWLLKSSQHTHLVLTRSFFSPSIAHPIWKEKSNLTETGRKCKMMCLAGLMVMQNLKRVLVDLSSFIYLKSGFSLSTWKGNRFYIRFLFLGKNFAIERSDTIIIIIKGKVSSYSCQWYF